MSYDDEHEIYRITGGNNFCGDFAVLLGLVSIDLILKLCYTIRVIIKEENIYGEKNS